MKNYKPLVYGRRNHGIREKNVRFLIVCEGTKTEPNYFKSFIKDHWSEVRKINLTIKGRAKSTCNLLADAKKIREEIEKKRQVKFDSVWIVFDKDEFKDFNKAIQNARKEKIKCAWSNESFELWYCLHFENINTPKNRIECINIIEKAIKNASKKEFKYNKATENFYELIQKYGDENKAIEQANKLRMKYKHSSNYVKQNPRTEVDLLVNELREPNKLL